MGEQDPGAIPHCVERVSFDHSDGAQSCGTVERITHQGIWVRGDDGRAHWRGHGDYTVMSSLRPEPDTPNVVTFPLGGAHPPPSAGYVPWTPTAEPLLSAEEMYRGLIELIGNINKSLGGVIDRVMALEAAVSPDKSPASLADKALCWDLLIQEIRLEDRDDPMTRLVLTIIEQANQALADNPTLRS